MKKTSKTKKNQCTVASKTWERDSHGLFDYESSSVKPCVCPITEDSFLVRSLDGDVLQVSESEVAAYSSNNFKSLIRVSPDGTSGDKFVVQSCSTDNIYVDSIDKAWFIISSTFEGGVNKTHKIASGDILKFGRIILKVKSYRIEEATNPEDKGDTIHEHGAMDAKQCSEIPTESDYCKFCYERDKTGNPLISICKCMGTVKFVHIGCLKSWMNSKINKTTTSYIHSYTWASFECEICKTLYPFQVTRDNVNYDLIDAKVPDSGNYLMLETISSGKHTSRAIHTIFPNATKTTFKIGRGHEAEVRISDISVSRVHAFIKFSSEGIFLEDNKSKFGSLVLAPYKFSIDMKKRYRMQFGRTVFVLAVEQMISESEGEETGSDHGSVTLQKGKTESDGEEDQSLISKPPPPDKE